MSELALIDIYASGRASGWCAPGGSTVEVPLDGAYRPLGGGASYAGGVVVSLPLAMLDFRVIKLPFNETARIRQVLNFELDGLVIGDPSALAMDAAVIGKDGAEWSVLVAFAPMASVRAVLDGLISSGLKPVAVTSVELGHLLMRAREDGAAVSGLLASPPEIDSGARHAQGIRERAEPTLDLMRGELMSARKYARARRALAQGALLAAAIALVLAAHFHYSWRASSARAAEASAKAVALYQELFPGERADDAAGLSYKAEAALSALRAKDAVFAHAPALDILNAVQAARSDGMNITELTLDSERVLLKGDARATADASSMGEALGKAGLLDVELKDTARAASGATAFTITARVK